MQSEAHNSVTPHPCCISAADGDDGVAAEAGGVPVGGVGGGGGPAFGGKTGGIGHEAGGIGAPIGSGIGDPLGLNNLEWKSGVVFTTCRARGSLSFKDHA